MNCDKVGGLIYSLRKEKGMTQKQLADEMNISDKTVSKWERGQGLPDVSLLGRLAEIFNVDMEKILSGDLEPNSADGGNMKKTKFYVCPVCGNITASVGEAQISCCGRRLNPLTPEPCDDEHRLNIENIEDEYYITFSHEMVKGHYLNFIAYVGFDRMLFIKLYPEQGSEVRMPRLRGGKLYTGCSKHGLWVQTIK